MIKNIFMESLPNIWPMIVIILVIVTSLRITYLITKHKRFLLHKELIYLIAITYILCLFYVVTFQDVGWSSHNFVPFKEIFRYDFGSGLFYKNIFGNMLLFVPYGIFIAKYVDLKQPFVVLMISFITSLSIEVIQFLIGRVFDVDDIILNVAGCLLGYALFRLFQKFSTKLPNILKNDIFWDIVSVIILGGLIWFLVP